MLRRLRYLMALATVLSGAVAFAIDASDRYRSPRNPERPVRASTELIVLHTTEAAARGSLKKLSERGECHFCVTEEGEVYRIVDRDREAFHAGRSMWNGKENVDKFSIGIECVGYHDKAMSIVQLAAIRNLVKELQSMYHLADDKVVAHSHIAYGAPNKWQKRKHRGRKRCGMLFAMPSVRRILGLKKRAGFDPDTKAGRLAVGDPYLHQVLYGKTDTMRGTYAKVTTRDVETAPDTQQSGVLGWLGFGTKPNATISATPPPAPPTTRKPAAAQNKKKPAKPQAQKKTTISRPPKSIAELKAKGFKMKGTVSAYNTASRIAGGRWNRHDTYYTIRNKVIPGNLINPAKIEKGMGVWMK